MQQHLVFLKLLSAAIILIMAILAGIYPFMKRIKSKRKHEFPLGEALAAGVFLGAGLMHMINDATGMFIDNHYDYPFAPLLAGATFLILLLFEHIGQELHEHKSTSQSDITFTLLAIIMLSVHSFLAGTALGLSQSLSVTVIILLAIIAHKWAAGFALAVQISKSSLNITLGFILFLVFCITTPAGILFGELLTRYLNSHSSLTAIFSAIAGGTFLYLGTLHGLKQAVMVDKCCNLNRYFFVIIGFVIMAIVAIWT